MLRLIFWLTLIVSSHAHFDVPCSQDPQTYPRHIEHSPCFSTLIHDIFVFGDSYSDNGQRPLTREDYAANDFNTTRWSNGPVTMEYFSKLIGANLHNYANSGATINNTIASRNTGDLADQYMAFQQDGKMTAAGSTAYVFWFGVNDLHDIFVQHMEEDRARLVQDALNSLLHVMDVVYRANTGSLAARYFMVFSPPPLQYLPKLANQFNDTHTKDQLGQLVLQYNDGLRTVLVSLVDKHPDARTIFYDTHRFLSEFFIAKSPFTNLFDPCLTEAGVCADPQQHFWWDSWHLSTVTHQLIASDAVHSLHRSNE
ncbi:hypothetical protein DM01DRAFT_1385952, partial [Hesseltinella vesiculosa]